LDSAPIFFTALAALLRERPEITVIYPTEDIYLVRLCEYRDRLPPEVVVVMPECDLVHISDSKPAMHALIDELGIPQAPFAVAAGKTELLVGRKAMIIDSRRHLEYVLQNRPDFGGRLLLRGIANGTRHNYCLVASEGRIIGGIQLKVTRTDRIDGTGTLVECWSEAPLPHISEYTERLLGHLKYTGPGMTQFIVDDENGAIAFLEINPRLGASCSVARHAGVDLVRIAFDLARGAPPPAAEGPSGYAVGKRFAWIGGDLNGLRRDWRNGEIDSYQVLGWLGKSLALAVSADFHVCWRWDDPLPALGAALPEVLYSLRNRLRRRA
jgi:hypothetical protein